MSRIWCTVTPMKTVVRARIAALSLAAAIGPGRFGLGADLQAGGHEHPSDSGAGSAADCGDHPRRHPGGARPVPPSYTDGYAIEAFTRVLAAAIVARPGWTVVVFPQIPLGNDPANTIGAKRIFPGSYPVRFTTLRAIYMDLASELGDQGFRWIFLVHDHGAPNHHIALNQASDYFHDTYGGAMVHLFGLKPVFLCCGTKDTFLSKDARAEEGFTVHAGADETSQLFFLRPDLIAPDFDKAPSLTAHDFADHIRIAKADGWTGYFGAPRLATAAMGAVEFQRSSQNLITVALQILDGLDYRIDPPLRRRDGSAECRRRADQLDHERTWRRGRRAGSRRTNCNERRRRRRDVDGPGRDPGPARPVAVTCGPGRVRL